MEVGYIIQISSTMGVFLGYSFMVTKCSRVYFFRQNDCSLQLNTEEYSKNKTLNLGKPLTGSYDVS